MDDFVRENLSSKGVTIPRTEVKELCLPPIARIPALSANEVARVAPCHGVLASLAHGVDGRSAAVGPPRVKVSVVRAYGVGRGSLACDERVGGVGVLALAEEVKGCGKNAGCRHAREEQKRFERHHCGGVGRGVENGEC